MSRRSLSRGAQDPRVSTAEWRSTLREGRAAPRACSCACADLRSHEDYSEKNPNVQVCTGTRTRP